MGGYSQLRRWKWRQTNPWSKSSDVKENNQEHVHSRSCAVPFGGRFASFIRPDSQEPDPENDRVAKLCHLCGNQRLRPWSVHLYSDYLIAFHERCVQSLLHCQRLAVRRRPLVETTWRGQWRHQPGL